MSIERALGIAGYMNEGELAFLAGAAVRANCVVEIGSWQGRSARALADHCPGIVFCVDTWGNGGEANFDENLADLLGSKVFKVKMPSQRAAGVFALAHFEFDLIFIDASHDYEDIKRDILAWRPLLRPGGLFCGHDYQLPFPGVIQAVGELVPGFLVVVDSIWAAPRHPR